MQNYKKIFKSRFKVLRTQHFRDHNNPFTLNKIFYAKIININFICFLVSLCKISKTSLKWIELLGCTIFCTQNGPIAPNKNFFRKIVNINSMYLLDPSIMQNSKKFLGVDTDFWGCTIFGPKMAHLPQMSSFSDKTLI